MTRPTVVNIKDAGIPEGAVYVGRTKRHGGAKFDPPYDSPEQVRWGNPFNGKHWARQYRELVLLWAKSCPAVATALRALSGRTLVCHCAPSECHGHVLAELVQSATREAA